MEFLEKIIGEEQRRLLHFWRKFVIYVAENQQKAAVFDMI